MAPLLVPLIGLPLLGILVALDERGLFAGIVRTPVLVGLCAGVIGGEAALGLAIGLIFGFLWPVPFRSGGHRAPSPGIAALLGAGTVSLSPVAGAGSDVGSLALALSETGNGFVVWGVLFGSAGTLFHRWIESTLRTRLGARETGASAESAGALRARALVEASVLGLVLGLLAFGLGLLARRLGLPALAESAGWDGGAWSWIVVAAVLGAASQLGRFRGSRSGLVQWGIGVGLGLGGGFVLGSVW